VCTFVLIKCGCQLARLRMPAGSEGIVIFTPYLTTLITLN
jgi:hypothetical protein